eukprot:403341566
MQQNNGFFNQSAHYNHQQPNHMINVAPARFYDENIYSQPHAKQPLPFVKREDMVHSQAPIPFQFIKPETQDFNSLKSQNPSQSLVNCADANVADSLQRQDGINGANYPINPYRKQSMQVCQMQKVDKTKYKTEMCKNWIEIGVCRYGNKCQFAHGNRELNEKLQPTNAKYKSKICTTFQERLFCPYGKRCLFKHEDRDFDEVKVFDRLYNIQFFSQKYNDILNDTIQIQDSPSKLQPKNLRRLKIFQQVTSETDYSEFQCRFNSQLSFNMYETPVKLSQISPKLQNLQSIKTDLQSSNCSGDDNNSSCDEEDDFKNHHSNFSNFLDELCGQFQSNDKENNLLSYKDTATSNSNTTYNSFYAHRHGYKTEQQESQQLVKERAVSYNQPSLFI